MPTGWNWARRTAKSSPDWKTTGCPFWNPAGEVAYISDSKLYITQAEILTDLQLGKFAYTPRNNGNLSLLWKG